MKRQLLLLIISLLSFTLLNAQDWVDSYKEAQKLLQEKQYSAAEAKAKTHLEQVTAAFGNETKYHAGGYNLMGKIYFTQGKYDDAILWYTKQKEVILATEGASHQSYAQALNNISVVYQNMGELDKIEPLLLEAIDAKKKVGDTQDSSYAKYLNNLAQYYYTIGRYPEAEGLYETSLKIKEKTLGTKSGTYGTSLLNLALLKKVIGKNDEAKKLLEEAFSTLKSTAGNSSPSTISAAIQLSMLYMAEGNSAKADELISFSENASLQGSAFTAESAQSLYDIAQAKIKSDQEQGAINILSQLIPKIEQTLGNAHPLFQKSLNLMGIAQWKAGNLNDAYNYLGQSLSITKALYGEEHLDYATALQGFAGILKETGDMTQAADLYNASFATYKKLIDKYFPHYTENEKLRFYSLLKERFEMYNNFVAINHKQMPDLVSDMYNFHIATKGLILEYAKGLEDEIAAKNDPALTAKAQRWTELKKKESYLAGLSAPERQKAGMDMAKIKAEADKLEKELSKAVGAKDKKEVSWKDIQAKLKPGEAAVEIVRFKYFSKGWSDSTFYAAMIVDKSTKNTPKFVLFTEGERMDGFHYQTYKKMVKSKFPDRKSYKVYWEPIDEALGDATTVYLSLDGVYNNISINSLQKPDGSYVIDDRSIKIIGNTKELTERGEDSNMPKEATLVGNPLFAKQGSALITSKEEMDDLELSPNQIVIAPLPGTMKEVTGISEKLISNGWQTSLITESNASESSFKSVKNPGVLHVATHGYFLDDVEELEGGKSFGIELDQAYKNPLLRSGLLFTGASDYLNYDGASYYDDENGILTAYEAVNLDLSDTKLVVLSACETGLGKVMNGEGVFGLQRAFQIAGAENIIMSLWTVNDETTQMLMDEFYGQWLSGKDVSTAFRDAQLAIKENYPQPYYWAAFVLLGQG